MSIAAEIEGRLRELAASSTVEVRENGGRLAPLAQLSWELRGSQECPLLHLWSEHCNFTRRVLAITDQSEECLALAVERFGRTQPDRIEFVRVEFERDTRKLSREQFCDRLKRILAEHFPDETVESLMVSSDLEHSLSGNYVRGLLRRGSTLTALLAASDAESSDAMEGSLTFGLLWLEKTRARVSRGTVSGLRLILPANGVKAVAQACAALKNGLRIELYEGNFSREILERVDLPRGGNLDTVLVPHRESEMLLDRTRAALEPIVSLYPKAISLHPVPQSQEVWLRFRGLTIARWYGDKIFLAAKSSAEELTAAIRPKFLRLLQDLEVHRHPLASDLRHKFYRTKSERWLEHVVRQDVSRVDVMLDPRFVYEQVFTKSGTEQGIIDLLTVTRSGRLAILELKTSEHIHLPLQAAKYWLRIRHHLAEENFQRYGYFPGITLQAAPPLVYLVAPAMHFHSSTDTLLRYLTSDLTMTRIGVAESWRRGLRIVLRQ